MAVGNVSAQPAENRTGENIAIAILLAVLLGGACVVFAILSSGQHGTRGAVSSAHALEAGYALPQKAPASPQMDDVGSFEEVEREARRNSNVKQVAFVDGKAVCPACRMLVIPGSTRCPHCTQEFTWRQTDCDLCSGDGELMCSKATRQELWTRGLNWDGMARLEPLCEGVGTHACYRCKGEGHFLDGSPCKVLTVTCVYCQGRGKLPCPQCGGDGKLGN